MTTRRPGVRFAAYLIALGATLGLLSASPSRAAHDMSQACYICHTIQAGVVADNMTWSGTYAIWTGQDIGMTTPTGGKPIACDICHADQKNEFVSGMGSVSAHPVKVIKTNYVQADFGYGTGIQCLDCHGGNTYVPGSGNLSPDVSPQDNVTNSATDGYPNHDVQNPDNRLYDGVLSLVPNQDHLTLSTASYDSYDNTPATSAADSDSKYALCFQCHYTGSTRISRDSGKTIQADYQAGGHYFDNAPTTPPAAAGSRIPCSDCHDGHNSTGSSRLMAPKLTNGVWPGVDYANESNPPPDNVRTMCNACHDSVGTVGANTPAIRGVKADARPSKVAEHTSGSASCAVCHAAHNPKVSTDCLSCHTSGTGKAGVYEYVGSAFKGTGLPGGARPPDTRDLNLRDWAWSQHGNSLSSSHYASPYNTKGTNFCFKCHDDRHNRTFALIQADNTDTLAEAFTPVDNLSATTVANANNFCLSCHDGDGAADDVQIGGVPPPVVRRENWTAAGHGKESGTYTVSNNSAANLKCIACHEAHGSNHANLLPAADNTTSPLPPSSHQMPQGFAGMTFRAGTLLASALDFRDYTDFNVANQGSVRFDNNWKSAKGYGTTGDPANQYGPNEGNKYGLCDACHRDDPSVNQTLNKGHTHMGIAGLGDPASQMSFIRDCVECHDPHGGRKGTPNIYMVSDNIAFRTSTIRDVTFTAVSGAGSFDDTNDSSGNQGDLCTVCHESVADNNAINVGHNYYLNAPASDHKEGQNCLGCHPHGQTDNAARFGFPQGGACNSCHGFTDPDGMPRPLDGGTYHIDANWVIGTRGGDNTAHKIHVNYLVNRRGIPRPDTCYVCHATGGSYEAGGHPGNQDNTSFLATAPPPSPSFVQVALDNTGAVLPVWNGAGSGPTYSGIVGLEANQTNGWKTCGNTNCHYALSPSWSGKKQITAPPGTMTVSTPDALPGAGNLSAGSVNNVVDKIRLQTDATGMVTDNQFKVRLKAGSTAQNGADIAKVAFWEDVDSDNTVSAGDLQIGGSAVFSATDNGYTVAPVGYSVAASTTKQVLVAVDLAAGAVNGRSMTFSTVNGDITASYGSITPWTTFDSSQFTVSAPGTLTVTTPDALPAAGPVMVGSGNNLVDKINLAATGGFATVTGLTVKELGTAENGIDIAGITFWRDVNANGTLETGTDTVLGGAAAFNAAENTYSVSGLSLNVPSGATERILVVDNVAAGATVSRTIQTQVVDNTYVTVSAGTVAGTFPIAASEVQTISSGGQLTVSTPDALPAAGDIRGASDNNVMDKITLTAATANVVVSELWVKELGTALDNSDIASMSFVDNTGGANTLLGTATFYAGDNTYRLAGLGLTVAVGTPRTILVMANIANGATAARTVQTQVNDLYVKVSAGTVNTITPFSSTVQTIRALTGVIITDTAGSTTPVDTTNLGASGTHQFYATATYSSAALNQDVTTSSAWTRTGTAGGTVGASTGLYTAGTVDGTDNVTASYRGQSDNTVVNVTTAVAHTYFAFLPTTATSVGVDGNAGGWTSGNATGYATAQNSYIATAGRTPTPGGWGVAVNYRTTTGLSGTGVLIHRFYIMDDLTAANTIPAQTVNGQATIRAGSTADQYWMQLCDYNPAGSAGNCTQIGANSSVMTGFNTATPQISLNWTLNIPSNYTLQSGRRLQLRLFMTTSVTNAQKRSYFGGTTAGNTATSFTILETTTQNLAPPRETGDTTAIACNTCHQFAPDDATAGYKDSNQYYYAEAGSHAAHGVTLIGGTDPSNAAAADTCTICHLAATSTFGSDHMNGAVDLRSGTIGTRTAGPAYNDTGTYASAARSCASTYCHGGRPTPDNGTVSWGYGNAACNSCHAYGLTPAVPPTGAHARHDNTAHNDGASSTTPTRASNASAYSFSCSYCHYGTTHVSYPASLPANSNQAAQVTFGGTFGSADLAGAGYTAGGSVLGNEGGKLNWTGGTCATLYCHSNAGPVAFAGQAAANAFRSPAWNGGAMGCSDCHDGSGTYAQMTAAADNLSKAHARHAATDRYAFRCSQCHYGTITSGAQDNVINVYDNHVNGTKNVRFNTVRSTTINQSAGTYNGSRQCLNTYCHSSGIDNNTAFGAPLDNIAWNSASFGTCSSCHGGAGAATTLSPSHRKHTDQTANTGYNFNCDECHALTMAGDSKTTINAATGYSNHVDGTQTVSFSATLRSTPVAIGGSYAQGTDNCMNTYCHSDGTSLKTGTVAANSVTWGSTLSGCAACHGNPPAYASAANKANSHAAHGSYTCQTCHAQTTSDSATITGADNHVNGAYNVSATGSNDFTYSFNAAGSTCLFTSGCHTGTVTWGSTLTGGCAACHADTAADTNDFGYNNGTLAKIRTAGEWDTTGHGRTSAFPITASENQAPNDGTRFGPASTPDCTNYCHHSGQAHTDNAAGSNYFRLATGQGASGRAAVNQGTANQICNQCHTAGGAYAAQAQVKIVTAHYGSKHDNTSKNAGYLCWDCHDPHGDTNDYMLHAAVSSRTDLSTAPGGLGIPLSTANVQFLRSGGSQANAYDWGDYVGTVAGDTNRLCRVCHDTTVNHFNASTWDSAHNPGTRCTQCHGDARKHDINFRGIGTCVGCHNSAQGASPQRRQVTGATGEFRTTTHHVARTDNAYLDNTADGAGMNVDCSKCHWEGYLTNDTVLVGRTPAKQGDTNPAFHWADDANNATAKFIQVRVWSGTTPPAAYSNLATGTAIEWRNSAANNPVTEAINLNRHCLGCHSSTIGTATPFSDGRSPRVRSWDGVDIGTKYLRNGAANTKKNHPYSNTTYNVVPQINKALSAHYDLQNNQRGVGTTGAWANDDTAGASGTATGSVACFDCHNSHGSPVVGSATLPLVSYANNATLNAGLQNANAGGLVKTTTSGVSGYGVTYTPTANATHNWGAGSAMCFDCHVGASGAGGTPPKKYTDYGRTAADIVAGYYDPVQWRTVTANRSGHGVWDTTRTWEGSFAFKDNTIRATHFRNDSAIRALQTTPATQLSGLCTPCHDPHGVTTNTTYVADNNYGTPLLKGTWMTSPYFEDRPGEKTTTTVTWAMNSATYIRINNNVYNGGSVQGRGGPRMIPFRDHNRPATVGGGYGTTGGGGGFDGFFIDENTFGLTIASAETFDLFATANITGNGWGNLWNGGYRSPVPTITINRISQTNAQFAGLCERCHTPASLVNTASKAANIITHAHRTVKGWDALPGGPAAADIFKNFHINNTTNNGAFSQRLLGAWAWNNMAANFSDYRFVEDPGEPWSGFPFHWGINLNRTAGQFVNNYIQANYHQFPCSKCHAPHASRLPRLLRTNCLDTGTVRGATGGNSNWGTNGSWVQRHSTNATNQYINRFRVTSNTTFLWTPARAVRCHQDAYAINGTAANDTRWNDLTPW